MSERMAAKHRDFIARLYPVPPGADERQTKELRREVEQLMALAFRRGWAAKTEQARRGRWRIT